MSEQVGTVLRQVGPAFLEGFFGVFVIVRGEAHHIHFVGEGLKVRFILCGFGSLVLSA